MRSSRMRGYGSWCMGWREAERKPSPPSSEGPGIFFFAFMALVVFSCAKVAIETGNPMSFLLGLAVVVGIFQGIKS
ncbi:hypothetical protein EBZ39_13885 [bacterium]|nr:hypothetical protein [bacterium]